MHETLVAQQVVRAVLAEMDARGADGVRLIELEVGELEGLTRSAIREAFRLAARGTPLEESDLRITFAAARGLCPKCKGEKPYELPWSPSHEVPPIACPDCGTDLELRGGRGFVVRRATMVLEDP